MPGSSSVAGPFLSCRLPPEQCLQRSIYNTIRSGYGRCQGNGYRYKGVARGSVTREFTLCCSPSREIKLEKLCKVDQPGIRTSCVAILVESYWQQLRACLTVQGCELYREQAGSHQIFHLHSHTCPTIVCIQHRCAYFISIALCVLWHRHPLDKLH